MAGEAYHGVVCADDQEEKNQRGNHLSLVRQKTRIYVAVWKSSSDSFSDQWRLLPSVPNKQPADIETQIEAPANEESIRQHCRAAVNVAITIPTRGKNHS